MFVPTVASLPIITKPAALKCARGLFALLCSFALVACGGGSSGGAGSVVVAVAAANPAATVVSEPEPVYLPPLAIDDGWPVAAADALGVDDAQLSTMLEDIRDGVWENIDGVAIARQGTLLLDETLRTTLAPNDAAAGNDNLALHRVYSVTKSVTSTLVGIAIEQGLLSGAQAPLYNLLPANSPFANWDERKGQTTLEDFLTMRHGLDWDELTFPYTDARNSLSMALARCTDYVQCLLDLPLTSDPGSEFAYSTHATHTLGAIVAAQSGQSLPAFAEEHLLSHLQIREHLWSPASPTGRAQAGSGLFLSVRDMAKLGQLYLDDGMWGDVQVVGHDWIAAASAHQADLPAQLGTGYGYQWWRFTLDNSGTPVDAYAAIGYGGQYVVVVEAFDLVVAFTGANYAVGDRPAQALEMVSAYILPALTP